MPRCNKEFRGVRERLAGGVTNERIVGVGEARQNEKTAANRGFSMLDFRRKTGAGEAIRTLDPNLGKRKIVPSKE